MGIVGITKMFTMFFNADLVDNQLAKSFFRKPEMHKYAKAKKLEYNQVLVGKMSLTEFEVMQN